tara:strand:+ start:29087 stop:29722 length:636 start_codon:yes stop_codon:yes gene_type:complete
MSKYINPLVGDSGFFKVKSPFNIDFEIEHTVIQVSSLSSLITEGRDPWEEIYGPANLDLSKYQSDLTDDALIVRLQDTDGEEYEVPHGHFTSGPIKSKYNYQEVILTLNLGILEEGLGLEHLKNLLSQACLTVTGNDIDIKEIVYPSGIYVDEEKHQALEAERKEGMQQAPNLELDLISYKDKDAKNQQIIADQQQVILNLQQVIADMKNQ